MRPRSIKELMEEEAGNAGWRKTGMHGRLLMNRGNAGQAGKGSIPVNCQLL